MAYDNVKFTKPNMAVVDTYFYMFDEATDLFVCKTDDGDTVFMYPLNSLIGNSIKSLQYDGRDFWTLQDGISNGIVIKRWRIKDESVIDVEDEFIYSDDASNTYDSDAFAVEHYITEFDTAVSGGSSVIQPDEYYDNVMASGIILYLGPNNDGNIENVTISGVNANNVYLDTPIQYTYQQGDKICLARSFFVFNNYAGTDSSKGTLFRFDTTDGSRIISDINVEYKEVLAATFSRFQNILPDYPDAHALVYIKGTNAKLINMSDLINVYSASSVNDNFTGSNGSSPNSERWEIASGDPIIYDNALFCSIVGGAGIDAISSKYQIIGDFDVQISGSRNGYKVFQNLGYYNHFMKVFTDNHECEIGIKSIEIPKENLVGEYLMETISGTNMPDTSGYNNNGIIVGSPTVVSGVIGSAIRFRGTSYSDGVTLWPHSVANTYQDEFSFSVWFKSETTSGDNSARIIGRDCSDYWCILVDQSMAFSQNVYFYYSDTQHVTLSNEVLSDTWHHIIAMWDLSNSSVFFYFDNVLLFSTSSFDVFTSASRPIVIGCNTEETINNNHSQFEGSIDEVRFYNKLLHEEERSHLYKLGNRKHYIYTSINDSIREMYVISSGIDNLNYMFRSKRDNTDIEFYYKTVISGVFENNWNLFDTVPFTSTDVNLYLGLNSLYLTVSGTEFDDLIYNSGKIFYPVDDVPYYGVMNIDNVRTNGSTVIPVYDISIVGDSMYRLQDEATYYGTDNDWGSLYNYQVSPIRSFVDFITVGAYPQILPATGRNASDITAVVQDQYGQGAVNKPVTFVDDDPNGYTVNSLIYTDYFFNTGEAKTAYMSGLTVRTVTITATATQYD